jgi:hypothetical protein
MTILVSDTSVLIDLERGELIACAFKLSATFAVPDVLYERELRDYGGEELVKLGLKFQSLAEHVNGAETPLFISLTSNGV